MFKKIYIRLIALLLIFCALNLLYFYTFYKADLEKLSPDIVKLRNAIPTTDVFYFGESSNTTFTEQDSAKSSISDFTSTFFPKLKFTNVNKEATHAGIYRTWLQEFDRTKIYPRAIILTMNLRSFDAAWIHSDLENSLRQSVAMAAPMPPLLNRFFLSLQAFGVESATESEQNMINEWTKVSMAVPDSFRFHTVRQWDDAMAAGGHLMANGDWDIPKIELACHYIKAYAFSLNDKNPRIKDFDAIWHWCIERKVPLYLNLMSENVHYADSLVGKELVFLMRQNRNFLKNRYQGGNCTVVDNLELVAPNDFIDQKWTTEHYVARGRMRIAKNLAEHLKEQFKKEYVNIY